jgi:DMSO reductase anchor subunit
MYGIFLFHPLVLLAGNLIQTATAAITTKNSPLRYLALILCVTIMWLGLSNFHIYIQTTGWQAQALTADIYCILLTLFDRLIVRRWAFWRDYLGSVEASEDEREKKVLLGVWLTSIANPNTRYKLRLPDS